MLRNIAAILVLLLSSALFLYAADLVTKEKAFVVHEWAVCVVGKAEGAAVLGSPAELLSGLPKFVKKVEGKKVQPMGWDKPVIHLYGGDGMAVTIKVDSAEGHISAYWPGGKAITRVWQGQLKPREMMMYQITETIGMEWSGRLAAKPDGKLEDAPKDHWWSALRDVPSMYFSTGKECERFLFYEGSAKEAPVVTGTISADQLVVANTCGKPAVGPIMVIMSSGDKWHSRTVEKLNYIDPAAAKSDGSDRAVISKADFLASSVTKDNLLAVCRSYWEKLGMTPAEAKAIVKSWEPDLLHPWQILVLSPMPAATYDRMFPLTITPHPDKLVRAGVVFDRLKGKSCANIVPGLSDHIKDLQKAAAGDDAAKAKAAKSELGSFGVGE